MLMLNSEHIRPGNLVPLPNPNDLPVIRLYNRFIEDTNSFFNQLQDRIFDPPDGLSPQSQRTLQCLITYSSSVDPAFFRMVKESLLISLDDPEAEAQIETAFTQYESWRNNTPTTRVHIGDSVVVKVRTLDGGLNYTVGDLYQILDGSTTPRFHGSDPTGWMGNQIHLRNIETPTEREIMRFVSAQIEDRPISDDILEVYSNEG